jgi:2-oxoglutarate dehydrogenase E2 component (dihydrolipoamide succinyltransferase)
MDVAVTVPEVSGEPAELFFVQWLIEVGAQVREGEPIALLEADKAQVEILAPATGRLSSISAHPDDAIAAGQAVGILEVP